jgi:hypothetical protein
MKFYLPWSVSKSKFLWDAAITHHTSQLLQALQQTASQQSHAKSSLKAIQVRRLAQTHLIPMVRLNFTQLLNQRRMIGRQPPQLAQTLSRLLRLFLLNEEARSLRQEDQTNNDNDAPGELNSDRDAVAAAFIPVLCRVVDDSGEEETDRNNQLLGTNDSSTDPLR